MKQVILFLFLHCIAVNKVIAQTQLQEKQVDTIAIETAFVQLKDLVLEPNTKLQFSTISKIDLALQPVKNSQELMRKVPGLFIAQHAGGGKAEQIFLRGFDCDHGTDVRVGFDGMPVNLVSHAHGQGYADAHFIIPETIQQIDFGAGPYYTQHGNLNTAGYVNFASYQKIPKSILQLEAGRFDSYRTLLMIDLIKNQPEKQSAYLAGEMNFTNGPTQNKQGFQRYNIFGKYHLRINDATALTVSLSSFKSDWNASGQIPSRAVDNGIIDRFGSIDPTEGGQTERHNANLILSHVFKPGHQWVNQFYYSRLAFNLYSNFSFYLNDPIQGDAINQAESRNLLGYTSTYQTQAYFGNTTLKTNYGLGFRHDATKDSRLSSVVKRNFLSNLALGNIQETNAFAFMQKELHVGKWLLEAGLRADYFHFNYENQLTTSQLPSQAKAILNPKLNLQYTLNKSLQFFVKAGKGFHSNDTRVVVANTGKDILPAAHGADLGVMFKPNKQLFIQMAYWQLYLAQEFVYVGDEGNIEPSGASLRKGFDLSIRYQLSKHIFSNASLNLTKPRSLDAAKGEDYIPLAPTFTSIGGIYYKATAGWNGGLNYRYIQNRPANEDNSIVAKGYFLLDAVINYTQPKYEIGLSVENLLNSKWNEAQFATTSRLQYESAPVTELNYTPGSPFFAKLKLAVYF